jgi:enoyl-CoA hydratase
VDFDTLSFDTLNVAIDDGIAHLTINRPDKLNALSEGVLRELTALLTSLIDVEVGEIRGMIVVGAGGRAFIAGADIKAMSDMSPDEGVEFGKLGQKVTELFEALPFPVIACVDGYALGGGCEMAMSCDYIFATDGAVFGQPEVNLGLIPGFGGCVRLMRYVGPGRAKELIYTGAQIDAQEALRVGLVNRVLDSREAMLAAARESLAQIRANSPVAISICKEVINASRGESVADGLNHEVGGFRQAFASDERREGTASFVEKRTPSFAASASDTDPSD